MTEKTKLTGGLEKTVTWVWLDGESGQLKGQSRDKSLAQYMEALRA